ncbi:type II toxin-antitoxin system RelE/ParE family toxin [bacterium]|nr:type II toxin-antitoxin system RelE/ParE family toxin [bacterium]
MKIRRTRRFKKDYQKLSTDIQGRTDEKLRLLLLDRRHPSLRVHQVRGVPGLWELSVTMNYRVIFEIEPDCYVLLGVGPHDILDRF